MKITLMNGTMIDCTIDEYEELMPRGLLGNKKESLQEGLKELINWPREDYTPKNPYHFPDVALYGCKSPGPTSYLNNDLSAVSPATANTMTMVGNFGTPGDVDLSNSPKLRPLEAGTPIPADIPGSCTSW